MTTTKATTRTSRNGKARGERELSFRSTFHDRDARDRLEDRIGELVRQARVTAGRPLRDAADAAGLSVQHVSDCERGGRRFPLAALRAVAELLGLDVDKFVELAGGCRHCGGSGVRRMTAS